MSHHKDHSVYQLNTFSGESITKSPTSQSPLNNFALPLKSKQARAIKSGRCTWKNMRLIKNNYSVLV